MGALEILFIIIIALREHGLDDDRVVISREEKGSNKFRLER